MSPKTVAAVLIICAIAFTGCSVDDTGSETDSIHHNHVNSGFLLFLDDPIGDFHRFVGQVGHFAPDHLYEDDSRLTTAQLSWFLFEGGEVSHGWRRLTP